MTYKLYPDPQARALRVAKAPSARSEVAFNQIDGPVPPELVDPTNDYARMMFVRVTQLNGTAVPLLSVRADSGAAVVVSDQPQSVFAAAGQTGFVGLAWLVPGGGGSWVIVVGLAGTQPHRWTLGILNEDTADDHYYAIAVADTVAETSQPWTTRSAVGYAHNLLFDSKRPAVQQFMAADPGTGSVWLAELFGTTATIAAEGQATRTVALPGPAHQMAVDPATHTVWLTDLMGGVSLIKGGVPSPLPALAGAAAIGIDAARRICYAALFASSAVAVVDADPPYHVRATIAVGEHPITVSVDPASGVACVAHDGAITLFRDGQSLQTIQVVAGPRGVMGPGGHVAYVTSTATTTLAVVDLDDQSITKLPMTNTPPQGNAAFDLQGAAVDPGRYALYLAGSNPRVLDTRTQLATPLPADTAAWNRVALAVDPVTHVAFMSTSSRVDIVTSTPFSGDEHVVNIFDRPPVDVGLHPPNG